MFEVRVESAVYSPDGSRIVTAGNYGAARTWIGLSLRENLSLARGRLNRGFTLAECNRYFSDDLASCPDTLEKLHALFDEAIARANE